MLPTPHRRGRAVALLAPAALALLIAFGGCGSTSRQRLDLADASSLQHMLATVRSSAQRGDRGAVFSGIAAMSARVERLRASGALPSPEAAALRTELARALAAARRELAPPAAAVATGVSEAAVPKRKHDRRPRAGGDRGKGHDRGGGDHAGDGGGRGGD